ncbi:6169_t:CDS:2 [Ambispora leptoticha]|uniref:6169_t:CDS:1 n=1 Tax=Ambispora leptoticha TaxID=144679 RepID=A0A9N8YS15_9GLOM|nr:6169_t:CDS:2 [Ambispora leptoticha]
MSPQQQQEQTPSIRIVPHIEGPRSLHFDIIEREVPEGSIIKIGRFTDKAHVPNRVTFKSKVVSRGHAEIWCEGGKFFIRDTKSSSGTFLNHVRLSSPSQESKPYPLKDGDVVQLGVDYQGGTEEIYRCVKMRIELNRSWQRRFNHFNLNALKQVKQLTSPEAFKHQTTDCCICLCGIGPFQALFLAPCSHVFHYKCIRPILVTHHPGFLCPLCRCFADLEASVENVIDWEQILAEEELAAKKDEKATSTAEVVGGDTSKAKTNDAAEVTTKSSVDVDQTFAREHQQENGNTSNSAATSPIPINNANNNNGGVKSNITIITDSPTNGAPTTAATQLDKIQINGHFLTAQEIELLFSALNRTPLASSTASTSLTIPIPKNNKAGNSNGNEENDENGMLSRTLPSSPPQISSTVGIGAFEDDNSNGGERRLIREKHQNLSTTSVQDMGLSSASASDNDEDGLHLSLQFSGSDGDHAYSFITSEDGQENGKGVERLAIDRQKNVL